MMRTTLLSLVFLFAHQGYVGATEELLGEWSAGAMTTPHGVGSERRLVFSEREGSLFLTFKHTRYSGLRSDPVEGQVGPFRIKKSDPNRIIYIVEGREHHVTWRINTGGALEWGAIVSDDNLSWHFAREVPIPKLGDMNDDEPISLKIASGLASWRFLSDPFKVPVGEARIPGLQAGYAFYVHEKLPSYETGAFPRSSIRVMTRNEDGSLTEQFRMVWKESSGPYLEGIFSRGENVRTLATSVFRRVADQ